jgi:hypothetical protein
VINGDGNWNIVECYCENGNVQSVPRSKHTRSVITASQLMLYREIIAVCSQIHTKHINTLCGRNVEVYIVTTELKTVNRDVSRRRARPAAHSHL